MRIVNRLFCPRVESLQRLVAECVAVPFASLGKLNDAFGEERVMGLAFEMARGAAPFAS
jgi:hypothetical protein